MSWFDINRSTFDKVSVHADDINSRQKPPSLVIRQSRDLLSQGQGQGQGHSEDVFSDHGSQQETTPTEMTSSRSTSSSATVKGVALVGVTSDIDHAQLITSAPVFVRKPQSEGDTFKVMHQVQGHPRSRVHSEKDGKPVDLTSNPRLKVVDDVTSHARLNDVTQTCVLRPDDGTRSETASTMTSSQSRDRDDVTATSSRDGGGNEAVISPSQRRRHVTPPIHANSVDQGQGQGQCQQVKLLSVDVDNSRKKPQKPVKPKNLRTLIIPSGHVTGNHVTGTSQSGSLTRGNSGQSSLLSECQLQAPWTTTSRQPNVVNNEKIGEPNRPHCDAKQLSQWTDKSVQSSSTNISYQYSTTGVDATDRQSSPASDVEQHAKWTTVSQETLTQSSVDVPLSQRSQDGVEMTCGQSSPRCNDNQLRQWTDTSRDEDIRKMSVDVDGVDGDSELIEPPVIQDLLPANLHIRRGESLQLVAQFSAFPPPDISWFRANDLLTPDDRISMQSDSSQASLTINNTDSTDTGCYSIELVNVHGSERMYSSVTVEDRPLCPSHPSVTSITRRSVVLSWYGCSYDGGSTVTGYRIEQQRLSAGSRSQWQLVTDSCQHTTYLVSNLSPNTEYQFRVSAINRHGVSDPGPPSDVIITLDKLQSLAIVRRGDSLEKQQLQHQTTTTTTGCDDGRRLTSRRLSSFDTSPLMLYGSLSPPSLSAIRDEMAFEPREVVISTDRTFSEFYSVGQEIGSGKFGKVCLCTELRSGATFAAKFIRLRQSQREEFHQEITVMNLLRHPKILLLWDAFESTRELILVMEHVGGRELLERIISEDYMLTERECVHFMRQICDAVSYMHDKHVLHLDLKPENILCVTPNGNEIKIIDFGLARKFDPSKNFKVMFGTPEFVAPEVINYDNISFATDMWSVGVVSYLLLSGLSPFAGDSEGETLANVTSAEFDFDAEEFNDISTTAKDFIEHLLVKQPKKRMLADQCLRHHWLSQDVTYMRAKKLSTCTHRKFLLRRKWQKTGRALQALNRFTCLHRQSAAAVSQTQSTSKSSLSSGHGSDDVKVTEEADLSEVKPRSLSPNDQHEDGSNRDSGIVRSSLAYDDANDAAKSGGLTEHDDKQTSNQPAQTVVRPSSLLGDVTESTAARLSSGGHVEEGVQTSMRPDTDTTDAGWNSVPSAVMTNGEITPSSVCTRTPSTTEQSSTSPLLVSTSDDGETLKSKPKPSAHVAVTTSSCSVPGQNLGLPVSDTERSFSATSGTQEPSNSSMMCAVKTSTGEAPSPARQGTASVVLAKTPGSTSPTRATSRSLAATSAETRTRALSSPGIRDRSGRRVMNVEFLTASKNSPRPRKPPIFIRKMRNVDVVEGQTARFVVRVDGNPAPSVTWLRDGVELAIDGSKYSVEGSTEEGHWSLQIFNCADVDEGQYACTVTNDLAKITARSQLGVDSARTGKKN